MNISFQHTLPGNLANSPIVEPEFSRILTAAVINSQFRQMLLSNPDRAVEIGYAGEKFALAREDKKCLGAIRATSLADFAFQLNRSLEQRQANLPYVSGD
jgi:hypothetical protein